MCGLLLHPLGVRLNRGVDRMFYGDRADPARVLEATATGLREGLDLTEAPERVCAVVVESLRLGSAAHPSRRWIGRRTTRRGRDADRAGDQPADAAPRRGRRHPPRHRPPGETSLPTRDAELLAIVCDQVAPAVAALRLSDRLQHSRAAIVTAREEERRRLRRDLHDGVGAALAGVRLQVETARDLVTDPVASGLLQSAATGVATAVDDVRAITDDLRPAVLDDLGLEGGLRGLARPDGHAGHRDRRGRRRARLAAGRGRGRVLPDRGRGSGERDPTRRRTPGRRAPRTATPTCLSLQVEDDGAGLSERPRADGLGLASMRQRAEEIGGRLAVTSTASGTVVRADLPMERPMTRILLVDDHPLFLDGVRAALTGADDLEVVGEAHDGGAGIALAAELGPDVVLMDLNLPGPLGRRSDRPHPRRGAGHPGADDDDERRRRRRGRRDARRRARATSSRAPAARSCCTRSGPSPPGERCSARPSPTGWAGSSPGWRPVPGGRRSPS